MPALPTCSKAVMILVVVNIVVLCQGLSLSDVLDRANTQVFYVRLLRNELGALRLSILSFVMDRITPHEPDAPLGSDSEIYYHADRLNMETIQAKEQFKGDRNGAAMFAQIEEAIQSYNGDCRQKLLPLIKSQRYDEIPRLGEAMRPSYDQAMNLCTELADKTTKAARERAQFNKAMFVSCSLFSILLCLTLLVLPPGARPKQ